MGNTNWDYTAYWAANHPIAGHNANPAWATTAPTRYEIYQYEIQNNWTGDVSVGSETGTPPSGCGTPVTSVDRRLIYGAILNCNALEAAGFDLGGHEVGLPVEAFIGKRLPELAFADPDVAAGWERELRAAFDGRELRVTSTFDGPNGPIALDSFVLPERDATGTVTHVVVVARDVTRLVAAEEGARRTAEEQASLRRVATAIARQRGRKAA